MAEMIVLDPAEVATSRTALDITPWVAGEGIDWGDAEIQAYMADQARGAAPVDFRVPNRTITVPLALKNVGGTTFAVARTAVQAKASLFQRERGWLKRVTASGSVVFADVVNATLKLGGGWGQAHRGYDMDAQLVLEAQPDFYGAEVTLSDHVSPGNSELVFTETGIQGDYPARVRIVVDEDDAERELGLLWGVRSRTYSAAATARLAYSAGTLTPQDGGTVVSDTMRHATVPTVWTPILMTDIVPTGALTHTGTYRVWGLIQPNDATDKGVDVRFLWDVGDLSSPVENPPKRLPGSPNAYSVDLGEVRLDAAPSGTHRWRGQLQAKATTGPADVYVRKLWIVPVDEGYGVLRAPITAPTAFASFSARDTFLQTAGTLGSKTLPAGGTWATSGATGDFSVETAGQTAERTATGDTGQGRFAIAGTIVMTTTATQVEFKSTNNLRAAVVARYTDANNYVGGLIQAFPGVASYEAYVFKVQAGTTTILAQNLSVAPLVVSTWYRLNLLVTAGGHFALYYGRVDETARRTFFGMDTGLATGGVLASGKAGIRDLHTEVSASTRNYDNFSAYVPTLDAVMHPSQSAELRWDGNYREDAAGAGWGPVPFVTGDNPRLPPAGLENRTVEMFIRNSRGDFDQLPDNDFDYFSARLFYRPCWLFVS